MDIFDSLVLGCIAVSMGVILLIIKIASINNEKLHHKFKKSKLNDAAFWGIIASLIIIGLKLIFTNTI